MDVKNGAYDVIDGVIYQREGSIMVKIAKQEGKQAERIRNLVNIRKAVRQLLDAQMEGCSDDTLKSLQSVLHDLYDRFVEEYGYISSRGNSIAFGDDPDYPLLCSLEIFDEEQKTVEKAPIFTERTIGITRSIDHVETASEALTVSLNEKGKVDIEYMGSLTNLSPEEIIEDLQGVIFKNPEKVIEGDLYAGWETSDEYLSGNVREKLRIAKKAAKENPEQFSINVEALKKVQPKDLEANDIEVKLGATWIPTEYIEDFIAHILDLHSDTENWREWNEDNIHVSFNPLLSSWKVDVNYSLRSGIAARERWGTSFIDATKLIDLALNLKTPTIYNEKEHPDDPTTVNKKATILAREKQDQIKLEFKKWIFDDPDRREKLVKKYEKCETELDKYC